MNTAGGNLNFFAVPFHLPGRVETFTANLHAGVEQRVHLEIVFEGEVAVGLLGAEEAVGRVEHGSADDGVALYNILCLAAALHPAGEVLTVEQIDPAFRRLKGGSALGNYHQDQEVCFSHSGGDGVGAVS